MVKNLEDPTDPFFAVGSHRPNFGQRKSSVLLKRALASSSGSNLSDFRPNGRVSLGPDRVGLPWHATWPR